jgi:hypothetical protein
MHSSSTMCLTLIKTTKLYTKQLYFHLSLKRLKELRQLALPTVKLEVVKLLL